MRRGVDLLTPALAAANFSSSFAAFGLLSMLSPAAAERLFQGVPGANRFLPYLIGVAGASLFLIWGARPVRGLARSSLVSACACLVLALLVHIGPGGPWHLLTLSLMYGAFIVGCCHRAEIASSHGSGRVLMIVEVAFALGAGTALIVGVEDTRSSTGLPHSLALAAVAFLASSVADRFASGWHLPVSAGDPPPSTAPDDTGNPRVDSWFFLRSGLFLALLTTGVQVTVASIGNSSLLHYLAFEFGTILAAMSAVVLSARWETPADSIPSGNPPRRGLRISPVLCTASCLLFLALGTFGPPPPAIRWSCLFLGSFTYELGFLVVLNGIAVQSKRQGRSGMVALTKASAGLMVVAVYWLLALVQSERTGSAIGPDSPLVTWTCLALVTAAIPLARIKLASD